jgi:hypothetical protein
MASPSTSPLPFVRPRPSRSRPPRAARRTVDELPLWLRRLRLEVLLWAFHEGRPVDAGALTAVLGAKHARADEPFARWTRPAVRELLWLDVARWCEARGSAAPRATALTLWTLLDHLDPVDGFAPRSERLALLREPLLDSGGVDPRLARARRTPVTRGSGA